MGGGGDSTRLYPSVLDVAFISSIVARSHSIKDIFKSYRRFCSHLIAEMRFSIVYVFVIARVALAQSNGCMSGYSKATDTALYTTPYTYQQVISIIGSFKNLTWSNIPENTVTLDGVSVPHTVSLSLQR